ncbi:hypothetical protein ASG82_18670 [Mycobacterium sp. Soil538]|nr:hypothetical protein ASG82_18670 [Mycobacterium sp. Soil538]
MADTLPNPASGDTTRFEVAPDGILIPVPAEAPAGKPIRDDARITVSPLRASGYYVEVYNGPPDPPSEIGDVLGDVLSEGATEAIERAFVTGAESFALAFLEKTLFVAGILADILTTSPLLSEQYFRGTMDDGTQVTYVVLTPKE